VVLYVRTPEGEWNGAAGYAKLETSVPMTPTHRHYAASVTKMYTAAAVMLLVEDGCIGLDERISTYLPRSVYGRVPNGDRATVRQLLGHTSGIPDFSGDLAYDLDTLNDPLREFSTDDLLSYLEGQSAFCSPGSCYFYSNSNYFLLALLVDHVVALPEIPGDSHADVISTRILQPLGLDATYYRNEEGYPSPPGLVNSYHDLFGDDRLVNVSDIAVHVNGTYFGNTGLIAAAADYAGFIEALLSGGIVGEELVAEMVTTTKSRYYGLGLSLAETSYGTGIGHDGGDLGVLSEVRYFPDSDATIVLLVNGGNDGITDRLFRLLRDEVRSAVLSVPGP
ncbi:MAG TPA: serine hydrolase domain-containing protein, partial [Candidatus Krumholzibacterium sp.]|nr:serine hydrolase domain-containing protein [Candidatus Krumholzibacterium sp.]